MRRILLSFLMITSLTIGGTVSAWAAQDCPYLNAASSWAGDHDCCPDGVMADVGMTDADRDQHHPADAPLDCQPGQICRTITAIAEVPHLPQTVLTKVELNRQFPDDPGAHLAVVELDLRPPISA